MREHHEALVELSAEECRRLLVNHRPRLGRLAFMRNGAPLVLPMNYVAVGNALYFRTGPGSKLAAAANQDDVAFEIDDVDEVWREGWSVLAFGRLVQVTDQDELDDVRQRPLRPWAGTAGRPYYLRLDIERVSGRRLT
jgi:nitroimidazol reductase NimA-like FMN-containing flavoprotein (pyridoxamine 5'-phosphate oxidase superfamily)